MYSTHHGARKCAKELNRTLERGGVFLPLHRCQAAIASAGGFRNWHDLENALSKGPLPTQPAAFRKCLLSALPPSCRPPALSWLDRESPDEAFDEDTPPHWYRYTNPYIAAIAARHRRMPLLRIGSGPGQRLRESIVFGLLLQLHGTVAPQLDADTLDVICPGDIEMLFWNDFDHPRFQIEIETLTAAGIISVTTNAIRVHTLDVGAVEAHVASSRNALLEYWGVGTESAVMELMVDAFASIGVPNAKEIAEALFAWVDSECTAPSRPILDLLTDLAAEGRLRAFAETLLILKSARPQNAVFAGSSVLAIISTDYFARHLGLQPIQIVAWAAKNQDWSNRLRDALDTRDRFSLELDIPDRFALEVDRMAEVIARS